MKKQKIKIFEILIVFLFLGVSLSSASYYNNLFNKSPLDQANDQSIGNEKMNQAPPVFPGISQFSLGSENNSDAIELASLDFGEYCKNTFGENAFIEKENLCKISKDKTCNAFTLLSGECKYGIGIEGKNTKNGVWGYAAMAFPKKPKFQKSWRKIIENWSNLQAEKNEDDLYIISYDAEESTWKTYPKMGNYPELTILGGESSDGFFIFNKSKNPKFFEYPEDWSEKSFLIKIKEGWNFIGANINKTVSVSEYFNEYLDKIESIFIFDEFLNAQLIFKSGEEIQDFNISPNQAFWINAKEDFVINETCIIDNKISRAEDGTCDGDEDGFIDKSAGGDDCDDELSEIKNSEDGTCDEYESDYYLNLKESLEKELNEDHFFLLSKESYPANLLEYAKDNLGFSGSDPIEAANEICFGEVNNFDFKGKEEKVFGKQEVKAFLCTDTKCNNLSPEKKYIMTNLESSTYGGYIFETDSDGRGPHDEKNWSDIDAFGVDKKFYANRLANDSNYWELKSLNKGTSENLDYEDITCNNWSSNSESLYYFPGETNVLNKDSILRFYGAGIVPCSSKSHLICFIDSKK